LMTSCNQFATKKVLTARNRAAKFIGRPCGL
jgi:hypothetical protein